MGKRRRSATVPQRYASKAKVVRLPPLPPIPPPPRGRVDPRQARFHHVVGAIGGLLSEHGTVGVAKTGSGFYRDTLRKLGSAA